GVGGGDGAGRVAGFMGAVTAQGYDGVDLDMEPVTAADEPDYAATAAQLRARLDAVRPGMLLTAATARDLGAFYASIAASLDQINIMTYDLSGPYPGWVTWHNSAMYTDGMRFGNGRPMPSCDLYVQAYLAAGVPRAKLGMGVYFHGKIWHGATGPNQSIAGVTVTDVTFHELMDSYYTDAEYRWDAGPDAPYLSDTVRTLFISYDDPRVVAEKMRYIRDQRLGGVIIWDLASGYRAHQPGHENPLLDAIQAAVTGP